MFAVFHFGVFEEYQQTNKKCANVSKHYYLQNNRARRDTPQYLAALYVCLVRDTFCDSSRQKKTEEIKINGTRTRTRHNNNMKCLEKNGNKTSFAVLEIFRAHMFHILVILFLKVMTIRFAYQRQHFIVSYSF